MRRSLAVLLVFALMAAPAAAASLHVHDYADHDHPQHHHGPASHEHEHGRHDESPSSSSMHTGGLESHEPAGNRLESCDPGRHTVAVKMSCAPSAQLHPGLAELSGSVSIPSPAPARLMRSFRDIRVHGPPFDPRIPSRAPPLTPLA